MEPQEVGVRGIASLLTIGLTGIWIISGCADSAAPPPPPARIPGMNERQTPEPWQRQQPTADHSNRPLPPPPFEDVPLVNQEAPEEQAFIDAYQHVGRPRLVVWVAKPQGNAADEAGARDIDYAAMENILMDWLSAGGRTALIAPEAARQALTEQQANDLQSGQIHDGNAIGERLRGDVLVLVRAEFSHEISQGTPGVRLVASASNLKGGESLGRAVADVPPPLEKTRLNSYTRFVARKLMRDMTAAWAQFGGPPPESAPQGAAPPPPLPQENIAPAPPPPATQPTTAPSQNP